MPIRRLAGLAGFIIAAWMLWETIQPIQMQISRGSDLATELLNPPTALLRLIACALLIIGAVLAIAAIRGGAWLFCTGVVVFAVMTGAMAAAGADPSLWYDEAILTAFLFLVSANLLLQRRK